MWKQAIILAWCGMSAQAELSPLEAISMIESGNNDRAVGKAGEISRYQIRPYIWRSYSRSRAYSDPATAAWVAEQHLGSLESTFRARTGRAPSDFDRYVLWNAGFTYYSRVRFSAVLVKPVIRERAQRYANLRRATHGNPSTARPGLLALDDAGAKRAL